MGGTAMAWLVLFVACLFEVGMVLGLNFSEGFTRLWPSLLVLVSGDQLLSALGSDAEFAGGDGVLRSGRRSGQAARCWWGSCSSGNRRTCCVLPG